MGAWGGRVAAKRVNEDHFPVCRSGSPLGKNRHCELASPPMRIEQTFQDDPAACCARGESRASAEAERLIVGADCSREASNNEWDPLGIADRDGQRRIGC